MNLRLVPMAERAVWLIRTWRYPAPYNVYNVSADEAIDEFLDGSYYAAENDSGELIGFFCFGASARVPAGHFAGCYDADALDIGLGLRPDLNGQGLGRGFMQAGLDFAASNLGADCLRLSVMRFNRRAIRLYQNLGFVHTCQFRAMDLRMNRIFWVMTKHLSRH